jgi:hypothetical protein
MSEKQKSKNEQIKSNRVDPITETLINVTMLSELLIDEMCKLRGTGLYRANLKVKGKEFNIALLKATNNYYKQLGPEVSGYFTELGQEFAHMFDFIVQMSAKDRLDLFEYLSKTYKNENSSN